MPKQQPSKTTHPFHQPQSPTPIKLSTFSNMLGHKMSQLENKSKFFQGQLDPLLAQNSALKADYTQIQRQLKNSTEMLRNLLPVPSDPERKLALELAGIEGVSELIRLDWEQMRKLIEECYREIQGRDERIGELEERYRQTVRRNAEEMEELNRKHEQTVRKLQQQSQQTISELTQTLSQQAHNLDHLKSLFASHKKQSQLLEKTHKAAQLELLDRIRALESTIVRLHEQLNTNTRQHEANKKLLVEHYQQLAGEKERELREGYEYVIKMKEEDMARNIKELTQYLESVQGKVKAKEEQILQLYQLNNRYITDKEHLVAERNQLKQDLSNARDRIHRVEDQVMKREEAIVGLEARIQGCGRVESGLRREIKGLEEKLEQKCIELEQKQKAHLNELQLMTNQLKQSQHKYNKLHQQSLTTQQTLHTLQTTLTTTQTQLQHSHTKHTALQTAHLQLQQAVELYKMRELEQEKMLGQVRGLLQEREREVERVRADGVRELGILEGKIRERVQEAVREGKAKLRQVEEEHQGYLERLRIEQNRREVQHQQLLQSLQLQTKTKISTLQTSLHSLTQQNNNLTLQLSTAQQHHTTQLTNIQSQHNLALEHLHVQHKTQLQHIILLSSEKQRLLQQELAEKQAEFRGMLFRREGELRREMELKGDQYARRVGELERGIQMLKRSNGVAEVQGRFNAMLERYRGDAEKERDKLKREKEQELQNCRLLHEKALKQKQDQLAAQLQSQKSKLSSALALLQSQYTAQLTQISSKLSHSLTTLNEELIDEKQAHKFTKLTREEKINYLGEKIAEMKADGERKELRVMELEYELDRKERLLRDVQGLVEDRLRKRKEECEGYVERVKSECDGMIAKTVAECKEKVRAAEQQRIQFTNTLYTQFQTLKQTHSQQLSSLTQKYLQLQHLFQERPSREQDVHKIKQLTIIKEKLDLQAKEFQKKIVNANQIVKYLNLQLENYKDVYDIFGVEGVDVGEAERKREEFQGYIRNSIINLVEPKQTKRTAEQPKALNIRKLLKQRSRRSHTEAEAPASSNLKPMVSSMQKVQEEHQNQHEEDSSIDLARNESDNGLIREKMRMHRKRKLDNSKYLLQRYATERDEDRTDKKDRKERDGQRNEGESATKQLRSNAQIFLARINTEKPISEARNKNSEYAASRLSIKRRTQSNLSKISGKQLEKQKRYRLKDRVVTIQH